MNAHTIRCGLSLRVIVGVVVIPWTQQEKYHTFFLWYGYKKNNIMGIFDPFRKKKTPEELLRKKIRDGFSIAINNALKKKFDDPLLDGLLLKAAISAFYQTMKYNDTLHIMSGMYNANSTEILEEELKYVLNKWIPNCTNTYTEIINDNDFTSSCECEKEIRREKPATFWKIKSARNFDTEEINAVVKTEVRPSKAGYGNSVCFTMINGKETFIPLSKDSTLGVGESVDMTKAVLLTLCKDGESDIYRVQI